MFVSFERFEKRSTKANNNEIQNNKEIQKNS